MTISVVQCSDNTLTPCTLSAGESVTARIASDTDEDWWRLDFGDATAAINVTVYTTGNYNTYGELHISSVRAEASVIANDDDGGDGRNFRIVRGNVNPNENTYYINVRSAFGWRKGTYTLHLDTRPSTLPTFTVATTVLIVEEDNLLSPLTVATNVNDADGDTLTVMLAGVNSTPIGTMSLFTQPPTVALSGALGAQSIVLSGGSLNVNANGVWTATVHLSDGAVTESVGVVTISVVQCSDNTITPCTVSAGESVTARIVSGTDEDWWRLDFGDVTTPMRITIYTTTDDAVDARGMLLEQVGGAEPVLIAQNDNGGDGRNFSIVYNSINPGENTYYIKAEGAVGFPFGLIHIAF